MLTVARYPDGCQAGGLSQYPAGELRHACQQDELQLAVSAADGDCISGTGRCDPRSDTCMEGGGEEPGQCYISAGPHPPKP